MAGVLAAADGVIKLKDKGLVFMSDLVFVANGVKGAASGGDESLLLPVMVT